MRSAAFCLGLLLAGAALGTESRPAAAADTPLVSSGFREVVLSVSDLRGYTRFLMRVAGWKVRARGRTDPRLLRLWGLDEKVRAREVLMHNPGNDTGFVRLVKFQGAQQQQIRSNDQSWDTGGIFTIDVRVKNLDRIAARMQARNWQGVTDPAAFEFGPFKVKEWLARGPDGVRFALIERLEPPLEGWPALRRLSRVFNSTQIVPDIEEARRFYTDTLGFKIYLETSGASKMPGPNALGLPHNLSTEIERQVYILHPQAKNEGSVEILQFDGARGADFSARAMPPNLGIMMLRFPVADAAGLARELQRKGVTIVAGPSRAKLRAYGECELFAVRAPGGAWLEFFTEL